MLHLSADAVRRFLTEDLAFEADRVAPIGAGEWSVCFGFVADGRELVVRIGDHEEDFEMDARASRFAGPRLPIPAVLARGDGLGRHYCVSERVAGEPLEQAREWTTLSISLARALETMRTVPLPEPGWGGWGPGDTLHSSWRDFLLDVERDHPTWRTHGWKAKLIADPPRWRIFERWYRELEAVASDDVPRALVHGDLVNRNVHVSEGRIAGMFDWGCSIYGDPLYEISLLHFWAAWHPNMRLDLVQGELTAEWRAAALSTSDHAQRIAVCHLHNGLVHLAYAVYQDDMTDFAAVDARLDAVLAELEFVR